MALDKAPGGGTFRRPSNRGQFYSYVRNGIEITAKWPKKRPGALQGAAAERAETFRQVQWSFKFTDPELQRAYTEAVAHTPLLPRDLFTAAAYGRLLQFYQPDGTLITSRAVMKDVSQTLDAIASVPGSMLLRGPTEWVALLPGDTGDVLAMEGASGLPAWAAGGGGGGGAAAILPPPSTGTLQLNAQVNIGATTTMFLTDCWPQQDVTINRLHIPTFAADLNAWMRPVAYDWATQASFPSATTGAAFMETGPEQQFSGRGIFEGDFDNPVTLTAGRIYLVGWMKRGGTTNYGAMPGVQTRRNYSSTTVFASPPATLAALSQSNTNVNSFWAS